MARIPLLHSLLWFVIGVPESWRCRVARIKGHRALLAALTEAKRLGLATHDLHTRHAESYLVLVFA